MRTSSIGAAMFLFALVLPVQGLAQSPPPDPYPLRPADTSSPRNTLRSFLSNADQGIQLWLSGAPLELIVTRRTRARETLDFSQVVDSHLVSTQVQHILWLKEILDRIELPPDDQIPGDQEVADLGITSWTIPDTRITIAQVKDGPREGEFLFKARVVANLEEIYLRAKHLPYQPGATEGIYDRFLEAEGLSDATVALVRNRLKPIDTSDPRSTYLGFRETLERVYRLIMEANAALDADPPTMSIQEARRVEEDADVLVRRGLRTLDLSQLPRAIRDNIGIETALQLKEVMDRVPGTYLDAIPDAEAVRDWKQANREVLSSTPRPFRWQIPNTEIEIAEVMDGPRAGDFLFSAETVSRAELFYKKTKDLPYRPGATEGFYRFFISTPGHLVPDAHPLTRWVDNLPPQFMTVHGDNTVWQWLGLAVSVLAITAAIALVSFAIRRLSKRVRAPFIDWLKLLIPIFIAGIVVGYHDFLNRSLNITGYALVVVTNILEGIVYALAAWAVYALFKALAETVIASPRISDQGIDASLLRVAARLMGFLIGAWVLIEGVAELGLDVVPLLAGLGVGGLALALAARPTIENVIGGLILYANRPVRVGDFCRYGEDPSPGWLRIGTVEEIGLHSTRLRGIDRTVTNIPNAEFSNMHIVNLTKRDRMVFRPTLGLRYETTEDQLRFVLAKLRELLLAHPRVTDDPARVRFAGFAEYSMNVEIFAYVNTSDWNEFLAIREDINLRIIRIVKDAGTGFAFPSRALYHTRAGKFDDERQQAAERQVREWGDAHTLPFPNFPEDYREQITNTLDYPPRGSPDYKPRAGLPEPETELHGPPLPESMRNERRHGSEFEGN